MITDDDYATVGALDTVRLGAGIRPDQVTRVRDGNNLIPKLNDITDQLTINYWFVDAGSNTYANPLRYRGKKRAASGTARTRGAEDGCSTTFGFAKSGKTRAVEPHAPV